MSKKVLLASLMACLCGSAAAAPTIFYNAAEVAQAPAQGPVDCTSLSSKEQIFAAQMTDMNNRSMFCAQMTPDQRSQVMDMAAKPNSTGVLMTADQTMQQYMLQNNMVPAQPKRGCGCGK